MCFLWRSVALPIITLNTRSHQILPRIISAPSFWHNMIDRQRHIAAPAILAAMSITPEYVLSGKDDFLVGNVNVDT